MDITGEPTEEKVQDCLGSNNVEMNSSEYTPIESTEGTNGNEDVDAVTEHASTDDLEEENAEHEADEDIEE